jgi:hypothetical protein
MREIRLYGSEGGGMSNHLSLPLSGLKPQKHVFSHTPSCGRGRRCLPEGKRSPPPATPSFRVEKTEKKEGFRLQTSGFRERFQNHFFCSLFLVFST